MRKLLLGLAIFIIAVIVIYGGIVIYGNVWAFNQDTHNVPDVEKALYSARIENTGLTYFSDDARQQGNVVVLKGYWELVGQKYKYRDRYLVLDESIFGNILLRERR